VSSAYSAVKIPLLRVERKISVIRVKVLPFLRWTETVGRRVKSSAAVPRFHNRGYDVRTNPSVPVPTSQTLQLFNRQTLHSLPFASEQQRGGAGAGQRTSLETLDNWQVSVIDYYHESNDHDLD
jgi:hypothetical protein